MAEETSQPVSTEQPASTSNEQSLEQVFESYKVEPTTPQQQQYVPQHQSQPQQQQAPQQSPVHVPDPALDPEGFRRYESQKHQESQVLRQAVSQIGGLVSKYEMERRQEREEQDIKKAVGFLKEKVPDADDETLEVYLGVRAKKDPRLLAVWNNRDKNPKAWDAALKAIGNAAVGKFQLRADPQLAENQRAMKTAQQSMATAQPEPTKEQKMGKLQGADFDREWERIKNG